MEEKLEALLAGRFQKNLDNCTKEELFEALLLFTRDQQKSFRQIQGERNYIIFLQNF